VIFVDSCVLIDIFTEDARWFEWSAQAFTTAADEGVVGINPVVYAEISLSFDTIETLDDALGGVEVLEIPRAAAFLAARLLRAHRAAGGARTAPLPDFFIGAHAAVIGCPLLTRNPGDFSKRLPRLELISPG